MRRTAFLLVAALLSGPAYAHTHRVITHVRIDSVASVGVCLTTSPELPGVAAACLYSNRPYYQDMRELVWRAFETGATARSSGTRSMR